MSHLLAWISLPTLTLFALVVSAQDRTEQRKESPPPLGTASFTPPEGNTQLQPLTPENFVVRAAVTNMAEIELGQLALEKSADSGIRQYATRLIKDHQAAQAKLKGIAAAAKIALPGTVDEEHRAQKQRLAELVGADFDKQYLSLMKTGHERAQKLLETAGKSADLEAPLKTYASETLATVRAHAAEAEKLHAGH
jgi:putative membrane protein